MYNQAQVSERKLKKEKRFLEIQKLKLEATKEIKEYQDWLECPNSEKVAIAKKWKEYYEKVKTTEAYKDFFRMRISWKRKDMKDVQELVSKARKRLDKGEFLPKPKESNSLEFTYGIYEKYRHICNQIKYINKRLIGTEDVEDIFTKPETERNAVITGKQKHKLPYLDKR